MSYPSPALYPGSGLFPGLADVALQIVALQTSRAADLISTGSTAAAFEKPSGTAMFEMADAELVPA